MHIAKTCTIDTQTETSKLQQPGALVTFAPEKWMQVLQ